MSCLVKSRTLTSRAFWSHYCFSSFWPFCGLTLITDCSHVGHWNPKSWTTMLKLQMTTCFPLTSLSRFLTMALDKDTLLWITAGWWHHFKKNSQLLTARQESPALLSSAQSLPDSAALVWWPFYGCFFTELRSRIHGKVPIHLPGLCGWYGLQCSCSVLKEWRTCLNIILRAIYRRRTRCSGACRCWLTLQISCIIRVNM